MISLISPRSSKHILSIWYETFHVVKETRSFDFTVKQEHKDRLTWGLKGWAHFTSCHILCNRIRSKVLHTLYKLRSASHIQAPRDSPVFHPAEIHGFQFQFQNAMKYCLSLKAPHHKRAVSTFWKSICYMIPWSTAQQQKQAPKFLQPHLNNDQLAAEFSITIIESQTYVCCIHHSIRTMSFE